MSIRLRRRLPLVALIIVVGALLWVVGASSPTEAQQQSAGSSQLLSQLDSEGALVHRHQETGEVRFIGASKDNPIDRPAGLPENASPEAAARAHLAELGQLFGIQNQAQELRAEGSTELDGGRASTHFQQVHEDVPVLGGELNVQVDDANNLLVATGEVLPEISLDTEPGVDAQQAKEAALEKIAKDRELEVGGVEATEPELWIYDPSLLGAPGPDLTRLVWRMDVTPAQGIVDFRELVLVDAQSGAVLLNFDQIDNARNRNTHTANNGTTLPGTLVCNESNPTCSGGDADAVAAHRYAGETYDFYSANHARDSLNNAGMTLISTVHYSSNFQNAFWNGQQMVYGDGFAVDDVVGHELTHGVTDFESSLFYYYQSGAINESFSDVWGEFIDLSNTTGTDTADTKWLIGEDIPGIGAIRDMENPPAFGDPDRMLSPNYTADLGEGDSGGVHINSGVGNKAAYLLTDGGTFNSKTVTGLGITKVAKIYYEAQVNLLTSASDYQDLHANLRQACTNLTGTSGITAADCAEVKDAVDATEMNLIPTAAPNPEAPVCNTGQTATDLFNDNLENPASGNWTKTGNWFYPQNPNGIIDATYATSGTTNFWGYNQGSTGDYAITRTGNVTPPAGKTTYLRFNHSYGFEDDSFNAYDGGVLEYSTNGGSTWQDAGSLFTNNGYSGTISNSFGNPLGGRSAFVRESNGYISSRVNLSSLAGQNIRFRFRIGTDPFIDDYGWFIDDVRVYTCNSADTTAPTAIAPKHSFATLSTLGTSTVPVKLTWSATDNPGGSGIASYQLQQSINGGAYTNITLPSATATTISRSLAPGTNTYRFRVAAKDNAGNLSALATGPSFKVTAFQESSSAIVDTGTWTTSALSGAYGGSVQSASALGRNATFTVPAGSKNVEWVSYRGNNRGKAQVWLDGVQQDANPNVTGIQPFDLYSSTAQARKVVFSKAVSTTTTHKLEVRVLGQKNASSTSTRVDIDAFVTTS